MHFYSSCSKSNSHNISHYIHINMPKTRRRSSFWTKELTSSPQRIEVATLKILQEQEPNLSTDETDVGTSIEVLVPDSPTGTESKVASVLEDLENLGSSRTRAKHYLEHYFDFLHCLGLASFKAYWKNKISASFIIYQALFWLFSLLAIMGAVEMTKLCSIIFVKKGDLYRYVMIGRFLLSCAIRTYFVACISSGSKKVLKIFDELDTFKEIWKSDKISKVHVCVFGVTTLVAALIKGIFGWVFSRYQSSLSDFFLDSSYDMSLSLFVWTTNSTIFTNQSHVLYGLYADTFTPVTVTFGCMGIAMEFFGELSDSVINDIMFFSAVTIYNLANEFKLQMDRMNVSSLDILKQYKQLQNVSGCIEEAFGGLFKLSHANNLLSFGYLVLILVSDIEYPVKTILLILQIMKVEIACYLTIRASSVNKSFRQYVRTAIIESETTAVDMKLKALAIMDESLESPIGLGTDNFFIDETFVLKYATMAGTFSLFLIESERKFKLELE